MMNSLLLLLSAMTVILSTSSIEATGLIYKGTKLCSKHKATFCLSFDVDNDYLVLDKRKSHQLHFDIEPLLDSTSRLYTTLGKSDTKMCLVKTDVTGSLYDSVSLKECDTSPNELVISLDVEEADSFILTAKNYKEALCLTNTYSGADASVGITKTRQSLHTKSFVALVECTEEYKYGQEFQAVSYSARQIVQEEPRYGSFCLVDKPDLCLGVSLTNGTTLEEDKLVQVKNLTKNSNKDLDHLKLDWFKSVVGNKLQSAADLDLCMEAMYNVSVGFTQKGKEVIDDVLHLGACDQTVTQRSYEEMGYVTEETFAIVDFGNYIQVQTTVPGTDSVKCATVTRCVKHKEDYCVTYNANTAMTVNELEQGAQVRLRDCDSSLPSQKFGWLPDYTNTLPPTRQPTNAPTPEVVTKTPTAQPTVKVTDAPTVPEPTDAPVVDVTPPPVGEDEGRSEQTGTVEKDNNAGLKGGLAFVGVICAAIIIIGLVYAAKSKKRREDEDETFIARV